MWAMGNGLPAVAHHIPIYSSQSWKRWFAYLPKSWDQTTARNKPTYLLLAAWVKDWHWRRAAFNLATLKKKDLFIFIYMSTLSLSSDTPEEHIRSHYRWLWVIMWLLRIELRISGTVLLTAGPSSSPTLLWVMWTMWAAFSIQTTLSAQLHLQRNQQM